MGIGIWLAPISGCYAYLFDVFELRVIRLLANEELLAEFIPFYDALLAIILGTRLLLPRDAVEYTV